MGDTRHDVPQGTLELLILRLLAREPMHGWGVMQRLKLLSGEVFHVTPGSLFPALQRIEENGWASAHWDSSANNRRAKFYAITPAGRRRLARAETQWRTVNMAIARVLEGA